MTKRSEDTTQMLDRIKAQYLLRYGMEMDDWSAINLANNQEHFEMVKTHLDANLKESQRLHQTFKGSIKTISFASNLQSFLYGLGRSLPYSVGGLILGILVYLYLGKKQDYKRIQEFVSEYENIESYESLIREGSLKTINGIEFLVLKPAKAGNNNYGQVYEFDRKKKVVNVPLRALK